MRSAQEANVGERLLSASSVVRVACYAPLCVTDIASVVSRCSFARVATANRSRTLVHERSRQLSCFLVRQDPSRSIVRPSLEVRALLPVVLLHCSLMQSVSVLIGRYALSHYSLTLFVRRATHAAHFVRLEGVTALNSALSSALCLILLCMGHLTFLFVSKVVRVDAQRKACMFLLIRRAGPDRVEVTDD